MFPGQGYAEVEPSEPPPGFASGDRVVGGLPGEEGGDGEGAEKSPQHRRCVKTQVLPPLTKQRVVNIQVENALLSIGGNAPCLTGMQFLCFC